MELWKAPLCSTHCIGRVCTKGALNMVVEGQTLSALWRASLQVNG